MRFNRIFALFLCSFFFLSTPFAYAYRFVVYGDSRGTDGSPLSFNTQILGAMNAKISRLYPKPKFCFFLGDCVRPSWSRNYVHNNLRDWKRFMKNGLGSIPFYTSVGNNDLYGNTGWTEYPLQTEFQKLFSHHPSNGPEHYKKLAYSLEYGHGKERTLFLMLDSFGFYKQNGSLVNFDNGIDQEQLKWVENKAKKSKARYKFVLSHGPAFSIEGWPVNPSIKQVWNIMDANDFDGFYCAHEHIFSRWDITTDVYPVNHVMFQSIVGSAGSPLDDISLVKVDFKKAHIYRGYAFIVIDILKDKMVQKSYALIPANGTYNTCLLDKFVIKK
jgi:hypothetical protein